MSGFWKVILVILMIAYFISPIDFCPGPIDDIILLLCGIGGGALQSAYE